MVKENGMEPYYYTQMDKIQQNVYNAMKTGIQGMDASFLVPHLDRQELGEVFFKLRLDCPEIFYATGFKYRFYQGSGNAEIIPEYLFKKGKIKEQQKAMKARVEKLIRPAKSLTEWEKELYIHNFICSNVHYDKLKKPYSHEIIGPLGQGVGVCEGIAKTVKILCDEMGIWCILAISDANPDKKIKYRHGWNIIRINGTYYHLDVTFDNTLGHGELERYDYFNLEDKQIFKDHEPVIYKVPACKDGNYFYYKEKKLSFTKTEDIVKRAMQAMKKGTPFVFHWRGGHLTREVLSEIYGLLKHLAQEKGKYVRINLNWPQAILHLNFIEREIEEGFIIEAANEGE